MAKNIRTTIINDILSDAYTSRNTNLNEVIKKQGTIIALVAIIASWLFNFINIGLSSIYLGLKILKGFIGVGDFIKQGNFVCSHIVLFPNAVCFVIPHNYQIERF